MNSAEMVKTARKKLEAATSRFNYATEFQDIDQAVSDLNKAEKNYRWALKAAFQRSEI